MCVKVGIWKWVASEVYVIAEGEVIEDGEVQLRTCEILNTHIFTFLHRKYKQQQFVHKKTKQK